MKRRTEEISSVMTTTVLIMTRLTIPAKDFTVRLESCLKHPQRKWHYDAFVSQ